ncbi:hypothetical protein ES319_D02G270300v1 [Gossypium barbadense]|uniref:Uncharacterized protein n=2 Tax=Gossypium TaxID=3633 RepID=A0A5J5SI56_GOSBA|nr:hypothetical protein ES319_D02G270300v1 [Gossypium barbadense]TYG81312.1 hypothetical protein ES288_D02G289300v1 [Gossypium darwinii]
MAPLMGHCPYALALSECFCICTNSNIECQTSLCYKNMINFFICPCKKDHELENMTIVDFYITILWENSNQGKEPVEERIVHIDDIDPCHMDPCPSSACIHGGQGLETSFLVFYWFLIHFSLVSFDKGIMMDMELLQCDKELLAFGGSWN